MSKNLYIETIMYSTKDSDPYYIREILLLASGLFLSISYIDNSQLSVANYNPFYLLASELVYFVIFYAAIQSSLFAKKISSGQLGTLFISNFLRKVYIIFSIYFSSLSISLFLLIPVVLIQNAINGNVSATLTLLLFLLFLSTSLLYNSVGILISVLSRNQLFSSFTVFFLFVYLQFESGIIFPHNDFREFLMAGFGQLYNYTNNTGIYYVGSFIYLVVAIVISLSLYWMISRVGIRGGR